LRNATVIYTDPDTSRSYTYAQVKSTAIDFGKGLKALWDWKKGDVVALYTPNCIDTPAITWGTHWAGGILSPANPGYTPDELAFQLKDSGAKALVTQKPFLKAACEAAKKAGLPEDRIILMGDEKDDTARFKHFTNVRNISGASRYRRMKLQPKDLAFLVYSSGTTGHPKGVMLSHGNIVSNVMMIAAGEGGNLSWKGGKDGKGDKIMAFLPFFHIYARPPYHLRTRSELTKKQGLTCLIHQSLYSGFELIVMPKFDLDLFCSHIEKYQITFAYVVPPVVLMLGKSPVVDKYNLSSIRMINSGAAPLTRELVEAVYNRLKIPIKQGYGLSETSPTTHTQSWDTWNTTIGSVGLLLPNQTAKYMSPDEKEVPVGETGELWLKGPNIFQGYLNNPEGTKNALTPDGYFKTGDVGHQDANGNFYITDRVKELIKYKGFQVPPAELEGLLLSHPDIDDVAVIGIYNEEQATEVPRAFVVPKKGVKGDKETAEGIVKWLAGKVASHKRLRGGVKFVDEVPKSASGKILRRVLKEQAKKEQEKAKL
jgi:4-coumarate--CoA ligase